MYIKSSACLKPFIKKNWAACSKYKYFVLTYDLSRVKIKLKN